MRKHSVNRASNSPNGTASNDAGVGTPSTKHALVADTLREELRKGDRKPGDRIPSEQEIAKRFGVAHMTARQALLSLAASGDVVRIPRRGTFVADERSRPPSADRDKFVLLLESGKPSLDPYYLPPIIEAFEKELAVNGYKVSVFGYSMDVLNELIGKDALVCCVILSEQDSLYANILHERGNRVFTINRTAGGQLPFVAPDNEEAAAVAVEHLIALGHRRIGFVRGLPGNADARDRRFGYLEALEWHGLAAGPEGGAHFIEACGHEVVEGMLREPDPPTAVFCASDLSAIGAMKAVAEADLNVPRNVSVVGFGDFPLAKFLHPGLTTVRLPLEKLGATAARQLLRMLNGEPVESVTFPCDLVVRDTTGPVLDRAQKLQPR